MVRQLIMLIFRPLTRLPITADQVSGLSLLLSFVAMVFIIRAEFLASAILVFFVILLDGIDGVFARAKGGSGKATDLAVDRFSEGIILGSLGLFNVLWIPLIGINCLLSFIKLKFNRGKILPLRHFSVIILLLMFLIQFLY